MANNKYINIAVMGFIHLLFLILLNYLYGNQGYSAYLYLPIQLIFLFFISFASSRLKLMSIKFFLLVMFSFLFYVFFRGTSINRTPLKDLKTLNSIHKIKFYDIVSDNSLVRKLAVKKFGVNYDYYYISYNNYKKSIEFESIIAWNDIKKTYVLMDSENFLLNDNCLIIKQGINERYCFDKSIENIAFGNDSCAIVVLKSAEMSQSLNIDRYLIR